MGSEFENVRVFDWLNVGLILTGTAAGLHLRNKITMQCEVTGDINKSGLFICDAFVYILAKKTKQLQRRHHILSKKWK